MSVRFRVRCKVMFMSIQRQNLGFRERDDLKCVFSSKKTSNVEYKAIRRRFRATIVAGEMK